MHRKLATLAIFLTLPLMAAWTSQLFVTSASNQKDHMRNGVAGSALTLASAAVNTACEADLTDFSGSTDATADLGCHNTGEIIADTYEQATITVDYIRAAGTVVQMQCDTSNDSASTWRPIMAEDSDGNKTIRTWTTTTSVSGSWQHNFNINCEVLRCRVWADSGTTSDKVAFGVILSK